MTRSAMSRMISTIQFTLYSVFAFILFLLITLYATLSFGLYLPHVILPNFKAEQLYIKLDEKLILEAERIVVSTSNNEKLETPLFKTPKIHPFIDLARKNFTRIKIDRLEIDDSIVTFSYTDDLRHVKENHVTVQGHGVDANISYAVYDDFAYFIIDDFSYEDTPIHLNGESTYQFSNGMIYSHLQLLLSGCDTKADIYLKDNTHTMAFAASSNTFYNLEPIVKLFKLDKSISQWIVERNQAMSYQLLQAKGLYEHGNLKVLRDTLYLEAQEKDLIYTFNPSLEPVKSPKAAISFYHGVLSIKPQHALYNDKRIKSGKVEIDFNQEHVTLGVYLSMQERIDEDILGITDAYGITLPLYQEQGRTNAQLYIHVNLWTEEAYANGQFFVQDGLIRLDGIPYQVNDASIRLHKNLLTIENGSLHYGNIISANSHGTINLAKVTGDIYFDVQKLALPISDTQKLTLVSPHTSFQMHLDEKNQSYFFPATLWQYQDQNLSISQGRIIVEEKFGNAWKLEPVEFALPNLFKGVTQADFNISSKIADINVDLYDINYSSDKLSIYSNDKRIPIKLHHDDGNITLQTNQVHHLQLNATHLDINATTFTLKDGYLSTKNTPVTLDGKLSTYLSAHYKLGAQHTRVQLEKTQWYQPEIVNIEPAVEFRFRQHKGNTYVYFDELGVDTVFNKDDTVSVSFKDLSKLYPYSGLMQHYGIEHGQGTLTFLPSHLAIDLTLEKFFPLLSYQGKDITQYALQGTYADSLLRLNINEKIHLRYADKGSITARDIDFNLFPILSYIDSIDNNNSDSDNALNLKANATNSNVSLGSSGRRILADTISLTVNKSDMDAQLTYKQGGILFQSREGNLSVYGKNLEDSFMNSLFKFSTFKGGELSFAMQGPLEDMDGVINIKNSTIKDYTVINNTLAFFNTIPSLLTFSVPGYSKNGLKSDDIYAAFHKQGPLIDITDAKMTSKELTIMAKGKSDLEKENIDLLMQVQTDIGSKAKDIPLIGYLIFGEDSVSTTVRVHGDLKNPKVENSLAKNVIVAPFNIIKRTLTLPFQPFLDDEEKK